MADIADATATAPCTLTLETTSAEARGGTSLAAPMGAAFAEVTSAGAA